MIHRAAEVLRYLPFLWLLRFPILSAISLFWLGLKGRSSPLLRGLFDVEVQSLWLPTLCCVTAAASIGISMDVVLGFAPLRYCLPSLDEAQPFQLGSPFGSGSAFLWYRHTSASAGIAAVAIVPILVSLWQGVGGQTARKLQFMAQGIILGGLASVFVIGVGLATDVDIPLYGFLRVSPEGYLSDNEPNLVFGPTLLALFVSCVVYCFVGIGSALQIARKLGGARLSIGGLSAILILSTFLTMLLSALSFFWDKLYVPESAFVALLVLWGARVGTDRHFKVAPREVGEAQPRVILGVCPRIQLFS